jgi:hypothetical protein
MSTLGIGSRVLAAAALLLILAGISAPGAMAEPGTRVLDPRLSLVGDCTEEELDPVEDPGCPHTPPPSSHPGFFQFPYAVATDPSGDIYVANRGSKADGTAGRIDIFDPEGRYISGIPKGTVNSPQAVAVDSTGVLYAWSQEQGELLRFEPCAPYEPSAGEIEYCEPPTLVGLVGPECQIGCVSREGFGVISLAINPVNDHLFLAKSGQVVEYSSAAEGNEEIRATGYQASGTGFGVGMALDSTRHRLYVQQGGSEILIFELAEGLLPQEQYEKIGSIEASAVPQHHFGSTLALAVDEGTGHLYVYDTENTHLWELEEDGTYVATLEFPLESLFGTGIAIDNGASSPNGKLSEEEGNGRYLYVPSHPRKTPGHLFAFFVSHTDPPEVTSLAAVNVSNDGAELQAHINPGNLDTTYSFEFKVEGAAEWVQTGQGAIPAGNLDVEVSATASGLASGTHYVYRVVATNEEGTGEAEGSFSTYPNLAVEPSPCANALLRTSASALLPDCRAYELVTPPDTNARPPLGARAEGGGGTTRDVSPAGDKVPFRIAGGALPGVDATGSFVGDPYLATRTSTGWSTSYIGPSGAETVSDGPGTTSPDQGYSFWGASEGGSAMVEGKRTFYVRYPDGHSELIGQGSLGVYPAAIGRLISEGGGHIVFSVESIGSGSNASTPVQLEPDAAPSGTAAIYDRTSDGITHVVSMKPGNLPFAAGENAAYLGASPNGVSVAFEVPFLVGSVQHTILYLRYNNETTFEIGEDVKYAGIADSGDRLFYRDEGNLKAFDVANKSVIDFADTAAEVVPVTVSGDGSTAYFLSESAIPGPGPKPQNAEPQPGGQNLYRSREGQISFVGTVTERDVVGASDAEFDGLGLWLKAIGPSPSGLGEVPARSTPDGSVFLFKSRAQLTEYDSEGHAEVYRYDSPSNQLQCLSCNPTGTAAQSDSSLQSRTREGSEQFSALDWPENLRADGRRAFFESSEPLVAHDTDGLQDVYEWEDQGVGSCTQPGGCLFLISSPHSGRNEYLWAVSRSGDDVFFLSSDLLVGADTDKTPSIYDARVGGGFAEPTSGVCEGEGCRPQLAPAPSLPAGETPVRGPGDNVKPHACGKGKHKVKRGGKVRCVKKKHHRRHGRHHGHQAGAGQKGARR